MSGRKNILASYPIITNGSMSGNLTSNVTAILYLDNIPIQLVWTGSPVGEFGVEVSLNYNPHTESGTFDPIEFTDPPVATGAAGSIAIDLNQISFPYIRVTYTRTSGTGTLQAYIGGKMI